MTAMIPVDAIDPEAAARRWVEEFEYHVGLLPDVMDALVEATLPVVAVSRGGSRFDRAQVTGGGYIDNVTDMLNAFDQTSHAAGIEPGGAARDSAHLWGMVHEYTIAATAWLNLPIRPPWAPTRPPLITALGHWAPARPDADPLLARRHALQLAGWLIDNATRIHELTELEEYRLELFTEIRRIRGRYGISPRPRPARERCTTCGERAVAVVWVNDPNGSPKPIRVARCKRCGETWREEKTA